MAKHTQYADLRTAVKNAADLLRHDPRLAEVQAREILEIHPEAVEARRILANAYRLQKQPQKGLGVLEPLLASHSTSPSFLHQFAQCLGAMGRGEEATSALRRALRLDPEFAPAWQALGHQLAVAGDDEGSRQAFQKHFELSTAHPELVDAARLLTDGKLGKAERIVRDLLKKHPTDVSAIRILADIGFKLGQLKDAQHLLTRCLELAPEFHAARHSLALVLMRRQQPEAALREAEKLLAIEPDNPNFLTLKASIVARIGDQQKAIELYERVLAHYPNQARTQMSYGHALKTIGKLDDAVSAYRKCTRLSPEVGEAYWSLANLKIFRFSDEDIQSMRQQVTAEGGDADDQAHLAFALGKALEDRGDYEEAFTYYRRGNAIRRIEHRHDQRINVIESVRQVKALDKAFFEQRKGYGCPAPDPIFVVGLPRAGSTATSRPWGALSKRRAARS